MYVYSELRREEKSPIPRIESEVLLTLVALRIEFYFSKGIEQRMNSRDPYPSFFEIFAIFYIIGFVWQEIMNIWMLGVRAYMSDMWHMLDFTQNTLFICTIALRIAAWVRTRNLSINLAEQLI
ncbi:hypothetical protein ACTXT7_009409 [Hymenolepis weldensis]